MRKRYDLIIIYTCYQKNKEDSVIESFTDKETAYRAFDDKTDKSNKYYILFDKETGMAKHRGRRKRVIDRLRDIYSDSTEDDFVPVRKLKEMAKKRKESFNHKYDAYMARMGFKNYKSAN